MTGYRITIKTLAVLMALGPAAPVGADEAIISEFENWVTQEDMAPAALVVLDPSGAPLFESAVGTDINTPMPIASISKTIAGQCVIEAARRGIISLNDEIGETLGWSVPQGQVTYAELLTHSGGIGPDATQQDTRGRLFQDEGRIADLVETVRNRRLSHTRGNHSYNNENYLVLEVALSAALQRDAFEWCITTVPSISALRTLGIADNLSALGIAGGLEISTADLAQFFLNLPQDHPDWPLVRLNALNHYGPGIVVQTYGQGKNMFHTGGICTMYGPNLGAFAAQLANGMTIAITYDGCADAADMALLNGFGLALLRQR